MEAKVSVLNCPTYRVHDALYVFGKNNLEKYVKEPFVTDGKEYRFSLE
jgi:hypothetical protein